MRAIVVVSRRRAGPVIARAAALALLASPTDFRLAAADPAKPPAPVSPAAPSPSAQPPLVITMPDTQPALPSGMIMMDPSPTHSTGNANALEPNIDGGGHGTR